MNAEEILAILALLVKVQPAVAGYVKTLLEGAQGKSGEQFLAEADSMWAQVRANAQKQLGQ